MRSLKRRFRDVMFFTEPSKRRSPFPVLCRMRTETPAGTCPTSQVRVATPFQVVGASNPGPEDKLRQYSVATPRFFVEQNDRDVRNRDTLSESRFRRETRLG
jgi:hypothetical protein